MYRKELLENIECCNIFYIIFFQCFCPSLVPDAIASFVFVTIPLRLCLWRLYFH